MENSKPREAARKLEEKSFGEVIVIMIFQREIVPTLTLRLGGNFETKVKVLYSERAI